MYIRSQKAPQGHTRQQFATNINLYFLVLFELSKVFERLGYDKIHMHIFNFNLFIELLQPDLKGNTQLLGG